MSNTALIRAIANSRDHLYRVALAWCCDEMLADDLTQETLAAAISSCHQLRDRERLNAWLFTILHNCWNRHLRHKKPMTEFTDRVATSEHSPSRQYETIETVRRVRAIVATLSLEHRQVLSLVELEGLSYCEVAEVLSIPIGTVMSRLHRARKALVDKFSKTDLSSPHHTAKPHIRRIK